MALHFGTKAKDIKESTGDYLRSLPGNKDTKLRFHEEVDDWFGYFEHYLEKQAFPCTGDRNTCPGCTHPSDSVQKASRRYAANALWVDRNTVYPTKLPSTVKKRCETRSARNKGTITDRDYAIIKTGSGMDTEYDVEQEDRYQVDWSEYADQIVDVREILAQMFDEVWGEGASEKYLTLAEEGREIASGGRGPRKTRETADDQIERWEQEKKRPAKKAAAKPEPEEEPDEDDDEPAPRRAAARTPAKKAAAKAPAKDDEDEALTVEQLRAMKLPELTKLAEKHDIDVSEAEDKAEMIQLILDAADAPPF